MAAGSDASGGGRETTEPAPTAALDREDASARGPDGAKALAEAPSARPDGNPTPSSTGRAARPVPEAEREKPARDDPETTAAADRARPSPDTAAADASTAPALDDFGLPIRPANPVIPYTTADEAGEDDKTKPEEHDFRRRSTGRTSGEDKRSSSPRESSTSPRRQRPLSVGVPPVSGGSGDVGVGETGEAKKQDGTTAEKERRRSSMHPTKDFAAVHARESLNASDHGNALSEFSHQKLTTDKPDGAEGASEDGGWQTMPAFAPYDLYDDDDRLIAREHVETEEDSYGYAGLGGAGKGYTRVFIDDDDAESATSMDENTQYLFKTAAGTSMMEDEEEQRDAVAQMQATKDLLTEGQRIAYVGITRLHMHGMVRELEDLQPSRRLRKEMAVAAESTKMWSQKMMIRLYAHMDISLAEQVMIEQLSEHGVEPKDLTPALMANSRVKNPMAGDPSQAAGDHSQAAGSETTPASPTMQPPPPPPPRSAAGSPSPASPSSPNSFHTPQSPRTPSPGRQEPQPRSGGEVDDDDEAAAEPPPAYQDVGGEHLPAVRTPSQMPTTAQIDIDLRWTVLCDLFLVLIADSAYDARSRVLLERVGASLEVPWIDICKFERKVTDALEMQQSAERENWNEKDHMESRRKLALKRRYVMMGLATVGGGLVIGLSAGLLAPVIGAGLAAGFTTIGVTGTSSFLAGAGGAAIITSSAAASGSVIGGRAANRRTGAVRTFEYRPLHNNKRVNLIVTVSGWMTGKVDDVRLPYSTVDPVMGDIYSVLWEPEMLTSMGDTINILATEALTQGLQQLLGSTILVSLMAALQLPVVLTKLSYLIDNPWAVSLDRATMAGLILADSLMDRNLGTRPITLVGYSLGSRVIFSCLQELARKGAYGLVQNVFIFGSPVVVKDDEFMRARSVVSGRLVSGYNRNDWILGYLFRLTNGGIRRVAGLGPVTSVPGIENMDVTEFVVGHMDYRTAMPRLLRECGWLVESDEFTEIEDPDPENHAQRQRALINEIEEARKELEKEGKASTKKGGAFRFFSRKKKGEKQEWEIYEDLAKQKAGGGGGGGSSGGASNSGGSGSGGRTEDADGNNHGVLFDVEAIRAELAKEHSGKEEDLQLEQLQVRELESTLPPMKLDLSSVARPSPSPSSSPAPAPALAPPAPTTAKRGARSPRASLSLSSRRVTDTAVAYRAAAATTTATATATTTATHEHRPLPATAAWETEPSAAWARKSTTAMPQPPREASPRPPPVVVDSDGISMTFDSDFDDAPRPPAAPRAATASPLSMPTPFSARASPTSPSAAPPPPPKDAAAWSAGGDTATGAAGPRGVPALSLADPWRELDDDDDDDFGKEQEISMTFA